MAPLRVLLLLFLSMSLPALISVQTVASQGKLGIQNTKPLTFRYANNIFEFGPFKVDFSQDTEGLTYNLSTFLAYFATALDIPTSSGEIADNVFKEKLASVAKEMLETFQDPKVSPFLFNMFLTPENQNFIQQNHQEIKKYFMSVKESLRVMVQYLTFNCTPGVCTLDESKIYDSNEWKTYSDLLIYKIYSGLTDGLASWGTTIVDKCNEELKCTVEIIRSARNLKGTTSNLPGSTFQTTSFEDSSATRVFQSIPSVIFFIVSVLFGHSYAF